MERAERKKIVERKIFTHDEKIFILDKSDSRCSHCGKKLKIGDNFTVEHVIPISKGGTNHPSNIVALCNECNAKKDDSIIFPLDYFRYLKEEFMDELFDNQMQYYESVNWFSMRNFLQEDKIELTSYITVNSFNDRNRSAKRDGKGRGAYYGKQVPVRCILSRAFYSDLDEIYNLVLRYNKKFGIESIKTKDIISKIFDKGAFYIIRNASKELVAVIPVALSGLCVNDERVCMVHIFNPMCLYDKERYRDMLEQALNFIMGGINDTDLDMDESIEYRVIALEAMTNDDISYSLFKRFGADRYIADCDDDEDMQVAGLVFLTDTSDKSGKSLSECDTPIAVVIKSMSDAILKKLNMSLDDVILGSQLDSDEEKVCMVDED